MNSRSATRTTRKGRTEPKNDMARTTSDSDKEHKHRKKTGTSEKIQNEPVYMRTDTRGGVP
jgi:hypothetical protein